MDQGHDDDAAAARCTSQGLHGEKTTSQIISDNEHLQRVEMLKRKRASDIQASTSTSTPSADFFEVDNLPVKRRSKSSNQYENVGIVYLAMVVTLYIK